MFTLSPSKKAFWGVFAISCLAHTAVFGLPLSQPQMDAVEDGDAQAGSIDAVPIDTVPVEGAQPIAIATLPSSPSVVSSRSLSQATAVPPVLSDPGIQPVSAVQSISPQPAPQPLSAQSLPVLPEEPVQTLSEPPVESVPPLSAPPVAVTSPLDPPQPALASEPELASPGPDPLDSESSEPSLVVSVGENFPHLAGAQGNCYNLSSCYRLSDAGGYRQAAKELAEQMKGQGYTVNEREDIDGAGRRVFEVVMPGQPNDTYFLNVFSDEAGSAVYVLTIDIVTLHELQQLRV